LFAGSLQNSSSSFRIQPFDGCKILLIGRQNALEGQEAVLDQEWSSIIDTGNSSERLNGLLDLAFEYELILLLVLVYVNPPRCQLCGKTGVLALLPDRKGKLVLWDGYADAMHFFINLHA